MGNFDASGEGTGEAIGGTAAEELARTVGEVAMMPGENATRWPIRPRRKLANLQDRHFKNFATGDMWIAE